MAVSPLSRSAVISSMDAVRTAWQPPEYLSVGLGGQPGDPCLARGDDHVVLVQADLPFAEASAQFGGVGCGGVELGLSGQSVGGAGDLPGVLGVEQNPDHHLADHGLGLAVRW